MRVARAHNCLFILPLPCLFSSIIYDLREHVYMCVLPMMKLQNLKYEYMESLYIGAG